MTVKTSETLHSQVIVEAAPNGPACILLYRTGSWLTPSEGCEKMNPFRYNALMSSSQLTALINLAKENPSILHRLDGTEDLDSVVAAAKEIGFNITADDLMKKAGIEISEGELDGCCANTGTVKTAVSLCVSCE